MKILFIVSCSFLLGCLHNSQAFYLSRTLVSGVVLIGTSNCKALILKKNNEFITCRFIIGRGSNEIDNLTPIANGTYEVKNDTLHLHPLNGEIDRYVYLINNKNNKVSSLSYLPGKVVDENGEHTGMEIRGSRQNMNSLEDELIRKIEKQLK